MNFMKGAKKPILSQITIKNINRAGEIMAVVLFIAQLLLWSTVGSSALVEHHKHHFQNLNKTGSKHDLFQEFYSYHGKFITGKCTAECNIKPQSIYGSLDGDDSPISRFVDQVQEMKRKMALVSPNRKTITGLLMKAALTECIVGDIAETGVFAGGSSAVIMKMLLELDQCSRKFYVFDSFEGLPAPRKEDTLASNDTTHNRGGAGSFMVTQDFFINNMRSMKVYDDKVMVIGKGALSCIVCC